MHSTTTRRNNSSGYPATCWVKYRLSDDPMTPDEIEERDRRAEQWKEASARYGLMDSDSARWRGIGEIAAKVVIESVTGTAKMTPAGAAQTARTGEYVPPEATAPLVTGQSDTATAIASDGKTK